MKNSPKILVLLWICMPVNNFAQSIQDSTIEASSITHLQLNVDEVYLVEIETGNFSDIRLVSKAEGEYADLLQLETKVVGNTVYVNSLFDAILSSGYDKLSSHKIFAFQLKIYIPERLQVSLTSNIATLKLVGKLSYLDANLNNGDCHLVDFLGNATINTYGGNIHINTQDANVEAETRSGSLEIQKSDFPIYQLSLRSIQGDIMVKQLD